MIITLKKQIDVLKYRIGDELGYRASGGSEKYPDCLFIEIFGRDTICRLHIDNPDNENFNNPLEGVKIDVRSYTKFLDAEQREAVAKRAKWVFAQDLFLNGWIENPPPSHWRDMIVP